MGDKTLVTGLENLGRAPYRETKRLKASERKEIILKAAKEILVKKGFAELSLRYTAEKSGIRLATLQYYYKTKDELFRAAFESALEKERQRIKRMVARAGESPEGILRARISGMYKANLNPVTAGFFYQLWARANLDRPTAEMMDEFYERNVATLTDLVVDFHPALTKAEARRRAIFAMASLEGMSVMASMEKRKKGRIRFSESSTVDRLMECFGWPAGGP